MKHYCEPALPRAGVLRKQVQLHFSNRQTALKRLFLRGFFWAAFFLSISCRIAAGYDFSLAVSTYRIVCGDSFTATASVAYAYSDISITIEWNGAGISACTSGVNVVRADIATTNIGDTMEVVASTDGFRITNYVIVAYVDSLTIVSGATQTNVIGATNWAAIKESGGLTISEVTTTPNTNEAWELVSWTGGTNVAGNVRQRKVSKEASVMINVAASAGLSSESIYLWILWGTVTIMCSTNEQTPANAAQFSTNYYDGTQNLGPQDYQGVHLDYRTAFKYIPCGQLSPIGIHNIVTNGWFIHRELFIKEYLDCTLCGRTWTNASGDVIWKPDDTVNTRYMRLVPDNTDIIYDLDAIPFAGWACDGSLTAECNELYINIRQWITWNNAVASDQYSPNSLAYIRGKWKRTSNPPTIMKEFSIGNPNMPNNCVGCE